MKKIALLFIPLVLLPLILRGETYPLKLRASQHTDFLRVVFEGHEPLISKGMVYQRGRYVIVTFADMTFSIEEENELVAYKKMNRNTVLLAPGDFRGLKVFTLRHPARLVIDIYLKDEVKSQPLPPILPKKEEKKIDLLRVETIVIDPGHGGFEDGIINDNHKEKNVVLDIAKKLGALINTGSSRSFLTRGSDRFMDLGERIHYAKSKDANVFLSLHVGNHSDIIIYVPVVTEDVQGIRKLYLENKGQAEYTEATATLMNAMQEAAKTNFGSDMVSVKPIPFSVLSRVEAAALIIELPSFEDANYDEELKEEIANTLYKGLYIYEEIKER